jgi:hypothetical protein
MAVLLLPGCITTQIAGNVSPEKKGHLYTISLGNQVLEIDPSKGGRINSLKIDGADFLTDSTVNNLNWGSTLWFSPQSNWKWPPSPQIDSMAYTVQAKEDKLILQSQLDPKTGMDVLKVFSGNSRTRSYTLKYTITNRSDKAQKVAPWEVTRVKTGGLAFFPFGDGDRRGGLIPFTTETDGISWFQYREDKLPLKGDRQLYSDGKEGWLAEINDGVILIKKFDDIPFYKNAPAEGEIEWYASPVVPGKSYVEIEHQGAYQELQPGQSLTWEVEWFLRKLPPSLKPEAGNATLAEYARKIVR